MRPRVRHVQSFDGTALAYWTLGTGRPLVYLAGGPWAHVELWSAPECRQWYRRLAASHRVVRYDERGWARSQRDATNFSLLAHVRDLEAVVDELALDRFDLFAAVNSGPVAIEFAACHPQRVERLVLWCAWARTQDLQSSQLHAWRALLDHDWTLMTETCAHLALGWSGGDSGRRSAAQMRASINTETARAALAGSGTHDATEALRRVKAPALVLHRRGINWIPQALARRLADPLPRSELVFLEGESTAPFLGDTNTLIDIIEDFLAGGTQRRSPARTRRSNVLPADKAPPAAELTSREREVLQLLAGGQTNREIAIALGVSVRTIDRHVENLYAKLGARSRVEATAWALQSGLA